MNSNKENVLLVGLGNPGNQYKKTIHNTGSDFIEYILNTRPNIINKNFFIDSVYKNLYYSHSMSYMNVSGIFIKQIMKYNNIKKLIVVYDDIRVNTGKYKILFGGTHSGHNGIKSIIENCGNDFFRVKIGVGPKPPTIDLSDFVLSKINPNNYKDIVINYNNIWNDILKITNE